MVVAAECVNVDNDLNDVNNSIAKDDVVHNHLIDANEKEVVEKRAAAVAAQVNIISILKLWKLK